MRYIVFICIFYSYFLYGYDKTLAESCNNNFLPSCFSLLKQTENIENSKFNLYKEKILNAMDTSCKKDYQTCLILSKIYESDKNNQAFKAMKEDMSLNKIPYQANNLTNKQELDSISNEDSIVKTLHVTPDSTKATKYQERAMFLLETACYKADIRACLLLSYFYEYGIAVAQNRPKAERLVELGLDFAARECMLNKNEEICKIINKYPNYKNNIKSNINSIERKCYDDEDWIYCYRASLYYTKDFYLDPNNAQADNDVDFIKVAQLLQQACKLDKNTCVDTLFRYKNVEECIMNNDVNACINIQNPRIEFLALACNGGHLQSCYEMRSIPTFKDTKRYIKLLQRVCRGGVIESCIELSKIYEEGKIVPKNKEKSLSFMQRACSWSIKGKIGGDYCYYAGMGYENGEFVKQDLEKAIESYQFACEISDKNAIACERLGVLYETYKQDMRLALQWYKKACDQSKDSTLSCIKLAEAYYNGKFLQYNPEESIKIYEDILKNREDKDIYYKLAQIYSNQLDNNKQINAQYIDYSKSLQYYNNACKLGVDSACNVNITLPNLIQECKMENLYSCYELASIMELIQQDFTYAKYINTLQTQEIIDDNVNENMQSKPLSTKERNNMAIYNLYSKACKGNIKQACLKVYDNTMQKQKNIISDIALEEAICINLKGDLDVKSVCVNFAKYAIQQDKYNKAIEVLFIYKDEKSKEILDLLAKAYFYNKDYENVIKVYKVIYQHDIPSDYYYLAQMYENGLLVKQDYNIAKNIYKISNMPNSYLGLARMYEYGLGVSKSMLDAKEYYSLACPLESKDSDNVLTEACIASGKLYYSNGDFQNAQKYYSKACEVGYIGDAISCD